MQDNCRFIAISYAFFLLFTPSSIVFGQFLKPVVLLLLFQDPDGEHARRVLQRMGGGQQGGRGQDMGYGGMNIPPSIANNPNIPPEVIHALQAGRLGNTVFVANVRMQNNFYAWKNSTSFSSLFMLTIIIIFLNSWISRWAGKN